MGLAITAEPLVKIILTDKWLPCVPFLQIYCASYALVPIEAANLQAIKALGFSGIYLRLEIFKKIAGTSILLISMNFGIYAIAWGVFISGLISMVINIYPNIKLLNYSYKEQLKDILPPFLLACLMGLIVYCILLLNLKVYFTIIIQVILGSVLYLILAKLFNLECFNYLITNYNNFRKKSA
jgi:teichuronic acid exporter